MNIITVIITVSCYTINMTLFKLILQPGNNGLRNWFQYMAIYQEDHCYLFENIRCSKRKTRRDIQFKSKTQKLYKYIQYLRYYSNDYRPHKLLHYIFCFIVYLYYVLYFLLQIIPIFLLNAATTRSFNFNITFCVFVMITQITITLYPLFVRRDLFLLLFFLNQYSSVMTAEMNSRNMW